MKKAIFILTAILTGGIMLPLTSCSDKLDIQQAYGFTVTTMPVRKRITQGDTAEIRCQIVREGYYRQTEFYIRYFQPDGKGELKMDDGRILSPNNLYPLENEMFRLYYTSHCTDQQTIDVYIESNFGQVVQKTFTFTNESTDGTE